MQAINFINFNLTRMDEKTQAEEATPKAKTTRAKAPKSLNLLEKLLEIRKSVDYLQKASKGSQFSYTSSSQVLSAVRNAMNEHKVLLITTVAGTNLISTPNRNDVLSHFTELALIMKWVDVETGEELAIPWYGQGVDLAGEKGVGKALTYAEKYFILKQFNIPTDKDDPDAHQEKQMPTIDLKTKLIGNLNAATSAAEVSKIWTDNPKLKTDPDFKEAVVINGARFKTVDDTNTDTKKG